MTGLRKHTCNAFCEGTIHCMLVYSDEPDLDKVAQSISRSLQLDVVRIERARESLPRDDHPAEARQLLDERLPPPSSDALGILVWWQTMEDKRRQETESGHARQ